MIVYYLLSVYLGRTLDFCDQYG